MGGFAGFGQSGPTTIAYSGAAAGHYVTVVSDPAVLSDQAKLAALAASGTRVTLAEGRPENTGFAEEMTSEVIFGPQSAK